MNTIENLRIPTEVRKKEKDENGNIIETTETKMVLRLPNTVSQGLRFGYFLIDLVIIYALTFLFGVLLALTGNIAIIENDLLVRLIGALIFAGYYFILEVSTGSSIGKMIFGYTVIDEQAEKPKALTLLGRSFARIVPFEAFSCLSTRGWHDVWSKTYVVSKAEKTELQRLLGKVSFDEAILDS